MSIVDPVFGIDVHPEYQRGFDFERAKAQGYEYAFIKASEGPYRDGTTYVPIGFKEFCNRAKAAGLIVGLYHFLIESDPDDPQRGGRIQAEHFLRTINSVGGTAGKLICVDFEHYSDKHPWLTPGNATLKSFISSLRLRIGKHPIILYSGRGFWNGGDSSGDFAQYGADVAWDAYYYHMRPLDNPGDFYRRHKELAEQSGIAPGWGKPWGGVSPMFWQFTSAGLVSGMNIDVDAFRGTMVDLRSLAATPLPEPDEESDEGTGNLPEPTNGVMENVRKVKAYGLNLLEHHPKYWCWDGGSLNIPRTVVGRPACVDKSMPPMDKIKRMFCLTGDTQVVAKDLERSYKRAYSGEIITVQTARGHKLTGTPNHPVLTDKGWLPLNVLRKGSYVLSSIGFGEDAGLDPDDDERPTRLEDIHASLANSGSVERDVCGPLDFHGDGRDGEVEIVVPEGVLRDGIEAPLLKQAFKFGFPYAALSDATLAISCPSDKEAAGVSSLAGLVGGAELRKLGCFVQPGVLQALGLGGVPNVNAGLLDPSLDGVQAHAKPSGDSPGRLSAHVSFDDGIGIEREADGGWPTRASALPVQAVALAAAAQLDSGPHEAFSDAVVGHADSLGNLGGGLPTDVCRDKVISVDVKPFSGYVYNLQTRTGRYVANGVISHNCADLITFQLRHLGKPVPKNHFGNENYDGGTRSFRLRYAKQMKPFRLSECREGDVAFVDFQTSWAPEGHIGFCLGDGPDAKFLQSHLDSSCTTGEPGLNADWTIAQSHDGGYYTSRIPREAIWG